LSFSQKIALAKITLTRGRAAKLGLLIPCLGEAGGEAVGPGPADPTGFNVFMVPFSGKTLFKVQNINLKSRLEPEFQFPP
jgi:hypothetical protein